MYRHAHIPQKRSAPSGCPSAFAFGWNLLRDIRSAGFQHRQDPVAEAILKELEATAPPMRAMVFSLVGQSRSLQSDEPQLVP